MTLTRIALSATAALALAVTCSACGSSARSERAATLPSAAAESATATASGEQADLDAAGGELTQVEAEAALPTVNDLPTGWAVDPDRTVTSDGESDEESTYSPQECAVVLDGLDKAVSAEPRAKATADFAKGGFGPFLGVTISGYESKDDLENFDAIIEALGQCPRFTVTDSSGPADFNAAALSFPNLGDETVAVRFNASTDDVDFVFDIVTIRVGTNVVGIGAFGLGSLSDSETELLEQLGRKTVEKLAG